MEQFIHPAHLSIVGTIFFITVYFIAFRTLKYVRNNSNAKSKFQSLSDGDLGSISNKIVSIIQAITAVSSGLLIIMNTYSDVIYENHWLTEAYSLFAVNYFAYDIVSMFYVYTLKKAHIKASIASKFISFVKDDTIMFLHHFVLSIIGFPMVLHYRGGKGDFILACLFLTELSTPFVNMRGILLKMGLKNSLLYMINGMLVVVLFFACRILIVPFMYYMFSLQKNVSVYVAASQHMPIGCSVAMLIFLAPQVYWFSIIVKLSVSVVSPGKKSK